MANQKQDGSNIINAEYSTGSCRTGCEQCFINLGQQGSAVCKSWVNPGYARSLQFAKDMAPPKYREQVKAEQGRAGYKPPPPIPKGLVVPPDREPLLARIAGPRKMGFENIPTKLAWKDWVIKPHKAQCEGFGEAEGAEELGVLPFFLRVGSMSDTSWAPPTWLRLVRDAWADKAFFNTAIRTLSRVAKTRRRVLFDEYHSIVVTVNPGWQDLSDFRKMSTRHVSKPERVRERETFKRENWSELSPLNSMHKPRNAPMDFFHPKTCSQIGLESLESVMKFYRLRSMPTITPRWENDEPPDAPVVITQLRFKGLNHMMEWCRRYRVQAEIRLPTKKFKPDGEPYANALSKDVRENFAPYYQLVRDDDIVHTEVRLWTKRNDKRNGSPYAGEQSTFTYANSFWRPADPDAFNADPYVCDRLHGGCPHCGLCASLDGQGRTMFDVPYSNPLNKTSDDGYMLPYPYAVNAGYIGTLSPPTEKTDSEGNKIILPRGADFFATQMQALGLPVDVPTVGRALGWRLNPREPATAEECVGLFGAAASYLRQREYWCEGWNTHENAATSVAYATWSLMVIARQADFDFDEMFDFVLDHIEAGAGDTDVLGGIDELWTMWSGESPWLDQFGPLEGF